MAKKRLGRQTVRLEAPPSVAAAACVVGKKEGEGPLRKWFDTISEDSYFGQKSWERAESAMLSHCFSLCCDKAGIVPSQLDYLFAGDLLNQCVGSTFAARNLPVPYWGIYGACSTMAECLALAAMAVDGGYADSACAMTSSHFCSAERQFRLPLEYGGQRTPTAQWTVTGAGAVLVSVEGPGPVLTGATVGTVEDKGITDANNMGAAMAWAAYRTIRANLEDLGRSPEDYDRIVTGDLGSLGSAMVRELFAADGVRLGERYTDCGELIYDPKTQDVHCGGSGAGCSAVVLAARLLPGFAAGQWKRILFCGTGALLSPTTVQQKRSIPAICHGVVIEN